MLTDKQNIYQKIFEVKKYIASQPTKKQGHNKFSGYTYYTPEQIESLVISGCEKFNIDFHFELLQDSYGLYGKITIVNLEALEEQVTYTLRTEVPEIKATNRTQQYGGAMTYTRRYMLQNIFSIMDNELDFDNEYSPISPTKTQQPQQTTITEKQVKLFYAKAKEYNMGEDRIKKLLSIYKLDSVKNIPMSLFNELLARMEAKFKEEQNGALTH
jgi:hypothetical protein